MALLYKQEGFTKINRSVESVIEFQQNELQNQQNLVMLMNNKVAAISKTTVINNNLILDSKFLILQKQWSNSRVARFLLKAGPRPTAHGPPRPSGPGARGPGGPGAR